MSRMGENQTERERNQKNSQETKMPMQSKSGILCTATCDRMVGGGYHALRRQTSLYAV